MTNGICEDCDSKTSILLTPYGVSYMAEIHCPNCGVIYDTNLEDEDIYTLLKTGANK